MCVRLRAMACMNMAHGCQVGGMCVCARVCMPLCMRTCVFACWCECVRSGVEVRSGPWSIAPAQRNGHGHAFLHVCLWVQASLGARQLCRKCCTETWVRLLPSLCMATSMAAWTCCCGAVCSITASQLQLASLPCPRAQETGHKNFSLYMPAPVLTIQRMEVVPSSSRCLLVALANGGAQAAGRLACVSCFVGHCRAPAGAVGSSARVLCCAGHRKPPALAGHGPHAAPLGCAYGHGGRCCCRRCRGPQGASSACGATAQDRLEAFNEGPFAWNGSLSFYECPCGPCSACPPGAAQMEIRRTRTYACTYTYTCACSKAVVDAWLTCASRPLPAGDVRIYSGKSLVHTHTLPSVATALWFGRYGREENTLITVRVRMGFGGIWAGGEHLARMVRGRVGFGWHRWEGPHLGHMVGALQLAGPGRAWAHHGGLLRCGMVLHAHCLSSVPAQGALSAVHAFAWIAVCPARLGVAHCLPSVPVRGARDLLLLSH